MTQGGRHSNWGAKLSGRIDASVFHTLCAGRNRLVGDGFIGVPSQGHKARVIGKARPAVMSFPVDEKLKSEVKMLGIQPRAITVLSSRGNAPEGHDRGRLARPPVGKWTRGSNTRSRWKSRC